MLPGASPSRDHFPEMLIAAAIIYWLISIVFELIQSRIEAYYGKGRQR